MINGEGEILPDFFAQILATFKIKDYICGVIKNKNDMEREIKFRGKSIKDGKWLCGYLGEVKVKILQSTCVEKVIFENLSWFNTDNFVYIVNDCAVDKETIGQFTGLKDKNGNDIYDGDIVRWTRDNRLYLIKFQSGGFYASVEEFNKGIYGGFPLYALTECEDDEFVCEVIGNIFDNKELLED